MRIKDNYPVPLGWKLVECQDVIDVRDGTHDTPKYVPNGFPLITSKNLCSSGINFDEVQYISEEDYRNISKRSKVDKGDILYAMIGTIGNPVIVETETDFSIKNIALFKFHQGLVYNKFFKHMLDADIIKRQILSNARGGIQRFASLKVLRGLKIPLPPLAEQKRIAVILDKADAIRRKRRQAIQLADEFLRSVFLDMFGDPVSNPKNWDQSPIDDTIKDIKPGWSIKGSNKERMPGEWGVLKVSAVTSGRFLPEECKVVAINSHKREMVRPLKGDLLFTRANTRELVAATCIVERDYGQLFLPDKIWKIVPKQNILRSEFLRFVLAHPRYRDKIRKQATGTSGSMLNVSQVKIKQMIIPVPPLPFQEKFSELLWKLYHIRNQVEESIQNATVLFNSISQRAFRGEL
jgi:type I restriction enzyme S subunit